MSHWTVIATSTGLIGDATLRPAPRKFRVGDTVRITAGENAGRSGVIEKFLGYCTTAFHWNAMVRFEDGIVVKEFSGRITHAEALA